jgi:hypothetical protein
LAAASVPAVFATPPRRRPSQSLTQAGVSAGANGTIASALSHNKPEHVLAGEFA